MNFYTLTKRAAVIFRVGDTKNSAAIHAEHESPLLDPSTGDEYKAICRGISANRIPMRHEDASNYTMYNAVRYIIENGIVGDIVECGVESGLKMRIVADFLVRRGVTDRKLYLYDTFAGMTKPTLHDQKVVEPIDMLNVWKRRLRNDHSAWSYCSLSKVRENMLASGYPEEKIFFVEGNVLDTIPNTNHEQVALLRLDTDFYDSSKHELEHLYDLVPSRGGVVILDDYGAWVGQRMATDEFFAAREERPLMHRTCRKERVIIKQR